MRRVHPIFHGNTREILGQRTMVIEISLRDTCIEIHEQRVGAHRAGFDFADFTDVSRAAQGVKGAAFIDMVHLLGTHSQSKINTAAGDGLACHREGRPARSAGIFDVDQRQMPERMVAQRDLPADHFLLRYDPGDSVAEIDTLDPVHRQARVGYGFFDSSKRKAAHTATHLLAERSHADSGDGDVRQPPTARAPAPLIRLV